MVKRIGQYLAWVYLLLLQAVQAGQINWQSGFNQNNVLSNGAPMNSQMVFELGVFAPGFTPTAQNTSQWAANWYRASLAFYNPELRFFTGSFPVTSNALPFAAGTKGYIWGHDGACTGGEWILMSAPGWLWPSQNPFELAVNWTAGSATESVVGQVNGSGFQMKTAAVSGPLPLTAWLDWQSRIFPASQLTIPAVSGPQADPDADGVVNLAEYALGGHPLIAGGTHGRVTPGWITHAGRPRLTMTVTKRCDRVLNWGGEASLDLDEWPAGGAVIVSETAEQLVVREDLTNAGSARCFLRPLFSLP